MYAVVWQDTDKSVQSVDVFAAHVDARDYLEAWVKDLSDEGISPTTTSRSYTEFDNGERLTLVHASSVSR